ncbi:Mobile element protein [hydrothermal vent metagenome]|uniref:Mobile element protein n=1 Tax=hydrothermal vent metagenome TaxID=652676 RepID=A0A3B1C9Q8_9ZZZZ
MKSKGIEISDVFREYGSEFRNIYHLPENQTSIMNLIVNCRTAALGSHIEKCDNCGYETIAYNSCRNRHCPKCQYRAREEWIASRERELLPVPYYHIVFTIPEILNNLVLVNKRILYGILFKAASETLLTLSKDPKHLGAEIGIIAVLHTWGQNLMDHPHLHCIVPGGGLTQEGKKWKYSKKFKYSKFFIHVNIISDLFKKKFLYYFKKAYKNKELKFIGKAKSYDVIDEFYKLLNLLYDKKWITYCKRPFGGPEKVLEYLGRYTHRVAISNNRIKRIENEKVVFEYKDYRDNKRKEMALSPVEFIRRFMLHILPEGFFKIRYYGILSSRKKKTALQRCRMILTKRKGKESQNTETIKSFRWECPKCKSCEMHTLRLKVKLAPG